MDHIAIYTIIYAYCVEANKWRDPQGISSLDIILIAGYSHIVYPRGSSSKIASKIAMQKVYEHFVPHLLCDARRGFA